MTGKHAAKALVLAGVLLVLAPALAFASNETGSPEWYKNGKLVASGSHLPVVGFGQITFESSGEVEPEPGSGKKEKELEIECSNLFVGGVWNEGSPLRGYAQIDEWWAMGHVPTPEHTELGELCRFTYLGEAAGEAWVTAERPLEISEQEGLVCRNASKRFLSECKSEEEREQRTMIRTAHRPPLTVPWNGELVVKEGRTYTKLGIPSEAGKSCSETPAPPGCIRMAILYPEIDLQLPFEGSLEVKTINGSKNGLSPSTLEFEGPKSGGLVIPGTSGESSVFVAGSVKFLGAEGRELLIAH